MDKKIDTLCVQAGYTPKNGEPRQIPIVQSTTFKYDSSPEMAKLFNLEASGYFYTRLQNPTNDYVAAKIAALEGGCSRQAVRRQTFTPCSISQVAEITSSAVPQFTAARSTCLRLR